MTSQPLEQTPAMLGTLDPSEVLRAAATSDAVRAAAAQLLQRLEPDGADFAKLRVGKVVSFNATTWTATITVAGSPTQIAGVACLTDRPLAANNVVVVTHMGANYVVIGTVSAPSATNLPVEIGISGILSAPQAVGTGVWSVIINWNTTQYLGPIAGPPEVGLVWITGGQWRVDAPGWWEIKLGFSYTSGNAHPGRFAAICIDGNRQIAQGYPGSSGHTHGGYLSWETRLTAGQVLSFQTYQDSGATINLAGGVGGAEYRTWYSMRRVAL